MKRRRVPWEPRPDLRNRKYLAAAQRLAALKTANRRGASYVDKLVEAAAASAARTLAADVREVRDAVRSLDSLEGGRARLLAAYKKMRANQKRLAAKIMRANVLANLAGRDSLAKSTGRGRER